MVHPGAPLSGDKRASEVLNLQERPSLYPLQRKPAEAEHGGWQDGFERGPHLEIKTGPYCEHVELLSLITYDRDMVQTC